MKLNLVKAECARSVGSEAQCRMSDEGYQPDTENNKNGLLYVFRYLCSGFRKVQVVYITAF